MHVSALESDGATYGVGMPIVLFLSPPPTDSTEFTKAVKVTVNGRPADGAWFWSSRRRRGRSHVIEAHYRMAGYWPAHSTDSRGRADRGPERRQGPGVQR